MNILITGRSGSGKSTVCRELQKQDYLAFDGDNVHGLARWVDAKTGVPVSIDSDKVIDKSKVLWAWDTAVLAELLATHDGIILCGSADNDLDFFGLFDKVFVLTLQPEIQRERIVNRTEHNYGKLPEMQERILVEQAAFMKRAAKLGAIKVDATRTPAEIVMAIMEHVDAR